MSAKLLCAILLMNVAMGCSISTEATSQASAELKDKDGKTVGMATFHESGRGVTISLNAKGLTPGLHAVHVHATGKCEPPAFTSAGGHFNPAQKNTVIKVPKGLTQGICLTCLLPETGRAGLKFSPTG
ncbi:MAG TPA: superoxide dismutase family protein [Gammaproteobacteria bacterium]|nr:superoxide dismutase family protein [Gammaproteobacteria bacterium]